MTKSPHEQAHLERREAFFGGHEHTFDPKTGLCVAPDCPSKVVPGLGGPTK